MIIRIWDYVKSADGLAGGKALQNNALAVALGCARYVIGLQLSPTELAAAKLAGVVSDYMTTGDLESQRIRAIYASNLPTQKPAEMAAMFAVHAASAGIERLRHIVWSHGVDESVDPEMMAFHRRIIAKVLQIEKCPTVGADHGDTDMDHHHEAAVTVDAETGALVEFGQGWWKEAAQIAAAICEFRSVIISEPNRRYVADASGVYHTFSDIRVADADGQIIRGKNGLADRSVILKIHKAHRQFKLGNEAPDAMDAGARWNLARAAEVLAQPRILNAKTWEEVHINLARTGFRYVKVADDANLRAVQFEPGLEDFSSIAAGAAYPRAALGKLSERLGTFQPAPDDLVVRPFMMPCFNLPKDETTSDFPGREARKDFESLEDSLKEANRLAQKSIHEAQAKEASRQMIKQQARQAKLERAMARTVAEKIKIKRKSKVSAGFSSPHEDDLYAVLFPGDFARARKRKKTRKDRERLSQIYQLRETEAGIEYRKMRRTAFIESENLIVLRSRSTGHRINALKLAENKFGAVKVLAGRRETAIMIELAAELGLKLDPSHMAQADQHLANVEAGKSSSRLKRHYRFRDVLRELVKIRMDKGQSRHLRGRLLDDLDPSQQKRLRNTSDIADERYKSSPANGDPDKAAMRILNHIPRNDLTLSSTRARTGQVRYADDPVLRKAFADNTHLLVREHTWLALRVLEEFELQRRRWICSAIISEKASATGDVLTVKRAEDQWAVAFYKAHYADPKFRRMLLVARAVPERFAGHCAVKPETAVWRDMCRDSKGAEFSLRLKMCAGELNHIIPAVDRKAFMDGLNLQDAHTLWKMPQLFSGFTADWPQPPPLVKRKKPRRRRPFDRQAGLSV